MPPRISLAHSPLSGKAGAFVVPVLVVARFRTSPSRDHARWHTTERESAPSASSGSASRFCLCDLPRLASERRDKRAHSCCATSSTRRLGGGGRGRRGHDALRRTAPHDVVRRERVRQRAAGRRAAGRRAAARSAESVLLGMIFCCAARAKGCRARSRARRSLRTSRVRRRRARTATPWRWRAPTVSCVLLTWPSLRRAPRGRGRARTRGRAPRHARGCRACARPPSARAARGHGRGRGPPRGHGARRPPPLRRRRAHGRLLACRACAATTPGGVGG